MSEAIHPEGKTTRVGWSHIIADLADVDVPKKLKHLTIAGLIAGATWCLDLTNKEWKGFDLQWLTFHASIALVLLTLLRFLLSLVDYVAAHYRRSLHTEEFNPVDIFSDAARKIVFILFLFLVLANFGYDVTTLIASLAFGSFALAYGMADLVSNGCGLLVILFERPFQLGDHISIGGVEGFVTKVTMRNFQIKGFDKSLFYIPNSEVLKHHVENHYFREESADVLKWTLSYDQGSTAALGQLRQGLITWLRQQRVGSFIDVKVDLAPEGVSFSCKWFYAKGESLARSGVDPDWKFYFEAQDLREQVVYHVLDEVARLGLRFATFPVSISGEGRKGSAIDSLPAKIR